MINLNKLIPDAKVAIVIDQPSSEDMAQGSLMNSKSCQKFLGILTGTGILPQNCSILTVYHQYLHKSRHRDTKNKMAAQELLRRELGKLSPNVIVSLGDEPLELLTHADDSKKYRGSVIDCLLHKAKVLSMFHPDKLFSVVETNPIFYWDCNKLAEHATTPDKLNKEMNIIITDDMDILEQEFMSDEYINDPNSLCSFDIECFMGELTCIGFAKDINTAYVIPLVHTKGIKHADCLRTIARILNNPVRKVAQNGNFDTFFCGYYYNMPVHNFYWDTMLAFHACYSNLPKGLDFLASIFTEEPYWKDEGKEWNPDKVKDWDKFFIYNGKDACNTLEIALAQPDLLALRGTADIFRQEMDLCYPLIATELRGININFERKEELYQVNLKIIRNLCFFMSALLDGNLHELPKEEIDAMNKKELIRAVGLNINSPKQMKDYLYNKLKLPKRVFKGKLTTNKDALLTLIPYDPPLMRTIMHIRDYGKRDTYYNMKIDADNRIRATFKPAGTQTGRLASSKSIIGTGFNLQNIPPEIRIFFVPDPGKIMINVDYGKVESWIVAKLARDEKMLAALAGPDFHSTNAENILGKPVTKENYKDRQLGKKISHAANYGMSAFLLQKVLLRDGYAFSKKQCQAFLDMYFNTYPNLKHIYHPWVLEQLKRDMTITNAFGRKITFWDFWNDRLLNKAFAFYPQSTAGDMTNKGLVNIYKNAPVEGFRDLEIMIQVHDSIIMQIDEDRLSDDLINFIKRQMAVPISIRGCKLFTIDVDVGVGYNWLELIDYKKFKLGENGQTITDAMRETFEEEEENNEIAI